MDELPYMDIYDHEESHDQISRSIQQKLDEISSNNTKHHFIFRIDNTLRETSKAAYEPEMVSIGPYHRGKNKLQKMENYKLEYLQGILKRQNETTAARYIDSLLPYGQRARTCYAEELTLNREEVVEMMLLDGCFIIEFLRKYKKKKDRRDSDRDPIFKMESILQIVKRDLLLFENQIPFFILKILFDMTKISSSSNNPTVAAADDDLISLAVSCLTDVITKSENKIPSGDFYHLLDLMYESWCSSFYESIYHDKETEDIVQTGSISNGNNNCPPQFSCINFGRKNREEDLHDIMFIKSVTELKQDGIEFVQAEESTSWLDIKFEEDGEIKIPPLIIHEGTESILKNLIAYELYLLDLTTYSHKVVTDYATFIDCLIKTPMDVQKLRVTGIMKNWLGSDEEITKMFNNIGKNIFVSTPDFSYRQHFKKVNEYCNDRRNPWISDLKNTHFKNPWSIISLVAAAILLILTLIQTVCSCK